MNKYFLKTSGREVKYGDSIAIEFNSSNNDRETVRYFVNNNTIKDLIKMGILEEKEVKEDLLEIALNNLDKKLEPLLSKKKVSNFNSADFLNILSDIYPVTVFNMLLKEIELEINKRYIDDIKDYKSVFVISTLDNNITSVNSNTITDYKNFSAFRNLKDAKEAKKALQPIIDELFSTK